MYHLYVGDFFIRSFEPLLLAPPYFQDEENNLSTFTHRHQHGQTRCPFNSDIGHLCLQSSRWRTSQHLINSNVVSTSSSDGFHPVSVPYEDSSPKDKIPNVLSLIREQNRLIPLDESSSVIKNEILPKVSRRSAPPAPARPPNIRLMTLRVATVGANTTSDLK